jgi:hypothetical protein
MTVICQDSAAASTVAHLGAPVVYAAPSLHAWSHHEALIPAVIDPDL